MKDVGELGGPWKMDLRLKRCVNDNGRLRTVGVQVSIGGITEILIEAFFSDEGFWCNSCMSD